MRVSLVSETYPPEINGVALTVRDLAHGLAARGHSVQVVVPRRPERVPEVGVVTLSVPGIALPRYPGLRVGLPAGTQLRRAWRMTPPDVIYIATEGPLGWSALGVARQFGIPVCTGFHTRFDHYAAHYGVAWAAPLVRSYLRRFHGRAAATLVPTRTLAQELVNLGIGNVCVMQRAVDTALFHPRRRDLQLRSAWGVDGDTPVVLYVGRIAPEKNLELAVRAFRTLQARVPQARFVWVGDGPVRAELTAAHPDFIFAGMRTGEDLARHYASTDLFLFPSLTETFGNVTLEAMASGLAVVAFDRGAAHEFLADGIGGMRVRADDARGFTSAAYAIAVDPVLRGTMGHNARLRVETLSPDSVAADFESRLMRLAADKRHDQPVAVAGV
ncbi:MAG: glycosyltransferase family 1 protein [Xanthomonadaceae bacterium]|nr:glycosyltransferase family 1 protein [Xanthomonadaceae bacterium]